MRGSAVIYREMPPIWNAEFRTHFYARWGRESAVIAARSKEAEYPEFQQLLSIKAAYGGEEEYFVDGRRVCVDDDTFLILNAGRKYGSRISSVAPMHSFSIFFRPGLAEEVAASMRHRLDRLLDTPRDRNSGTIEFSEQLHEHDRSVTPVLRHIHQHVRSGLTDELWLDEQLRFLLERLLRLQARHAARADAVPSARASTRKELHRRLGLAVTFMHTHYREILDLGTIANAAHLSPFHFLRTFKAVYGVSPSAYLNRKRTQVAIRLLKSKSLTMTAVAGSVGFGNRATLFRHLRAAGWYDEAAARRATADSQVPAVVCEGTDRPK